MITRLDEVLLCNFNEELDLRDLPNFVEPLLRGDWASVIDNSILDTILAGDVNHLSVVEYLKGKTREDVTEVLVVAISCINAFCECNWVGPSTKYGKLFESKWPKNVNAAKELALDGEDIHSTILHPELLMISLEILKGIPENLICVWWKMRCYYLYQKVLEENSITLYKILENILTKLVAYEAEIENDPKLKVLLELEKCQVNLLYGKVQNSEECLKSAKKIAGIDLELKGALGKRTKFQNQAVAQLNLNVTFLDPKTRLSEPHSNSNSDLIPSLKLDDDLRLENIQFLDIKEHASVELTSLEQLICLNTIQYLQRSQPKDALADEELFPFINILITQNHGPWVGRLNSLLIKCKLESNHKRTVERAMMQCELVVNSFSKEKPNANTRLKYLWASGLPLALNWQSQLADLLISIGLTKAALDIYLKLQLWEEVIVCYTILELRHKAAEIIQQQIDVKPTVKLYCLLGDATDDVKLYEKAWEFSQNKSSKAQRHWGNYFFARKQYQECIPHYQKSCEINSLQESVWLRLGYAALITENWEVSATAYRRYTFLEQNSFEAWNNLAKVYVKQGNKERAYKALSEALKFNYDNWQVWENMLVVSLDTGHFDDVIRSYHRLLDLRNKHLDIEVLTLLVKAIVKNEVDADGNSTERLIPKVLELFGRITGVHPNDPDLWHLYADVSPTALLKGQRLIKSYGSLSHLLHKSYDPELYEKVCDLAEDIATACLDCKIDSDNNSQTTELFSSARLTVQAVIKVVSKENSSQLGSRVADLEKKLSSLTEELKRRIC